MKEKFSESKCQGRQPAVSMVGNPLYSPPPKKNLTLAPPLFCALERPAAAARRVHVCVYEQEVGRRVGTARISRISSRRFEQVRRHSLMSWKIR